MPGGDLFFLYGAAYKTYGEIDLNYGWTSFLEKDGFCGAQAAMNVVEVMLQLAAVHASRTSASSASLIALIVSVMTLAKTVLYLLCEPFSGFKYTGHNSLANKDFWLLFAIPISFWITFPTAAIAYLYPRIAVQLAATESKKDH